MFRNLERADDLKSRTPETIGSLTAVEIDELRQIDGGTVAGHYQPFTGLEWYSPYDGADPVFHRWFESESAVRNGLLLKT